MLECGCVVEGSAPCAHLAAWYAADLAEVREAERADVAGWDPEVLEELAGAGHEAALMALGMGLPGMAEGLVPDAGVAGPPGQAPEAGPVRRPRPGVLDIHPDLLADLAPGPALVEALEGLTPADVLDGSVSSYQAVEVVAAFKRVEAWAAGQAAVLAAGLAQRPEMSARGVVTPASAEVNGTVEELALRLGTTRQAAAMVVKVGHGLRTSFTDTAVMVAAGTLDWRKAAVIVNTLWGLPDPVVWCVQQDVLPGAAYRTHTQLARDIAKALEAVDHHDAAARHRKALRGSHVTRPRVLPDGMASITLVAGAEDVIPLDMLIDAAAQQLRTDGDPRPLTELRAQALLTLGATALHTSWIGPPPPATLATPTPEAAAGAGHDPAPTVPVTALPSGDPRHDPPRGTSPNEGDGPPDEGANAPADVVPDVRDAHARHADPPTTHPTAPTCAPPDPRPAAGPADPTPPAGPADPTPPAGPADPTPADPAPATGPPGVVEPPPAGLFAPPPGPADRALDRALEDAEADAVLPPLDQLCPTRRGFALTGDNARIHIRVTVPLSVLLPGPDTPGTTTRDPADTTTSGPVTGDATTGDATSGDAVTGGVGSTGAAGSGADDGSSPEPPAPVEVAVLDGYGPITADVARALVAGGTWKRLVTDPLTGAVLDVGRTRYRPPADLAEHIRQRDRTCTRPGCQTPAHHAELDHTIAWSTGGTTAHHNLGPLCKRDHQLKTTGLFTLTQPSPGVFEWTTPTGHHYRRNPDGTITPLDHAPAGQADDAPPF